MGLSPLYISIAYYMQKGGGWVQIACKIAYVLNGSPLGNMIFILHVCVCVCPVCVCVQSVCVCVQCVCVQCVCVCVCVCPVCV